MVRRFETFGHKTNCLVLKMGRIIGLQATRHVVGGALVDDGVSSVRLVCVWKAEKLLLLRMVVTQHQDVLFAAFAWPKVDVVELHEIVRLRQVNGRPNRLGFFSPLRVVG